MSRAPRLLALTTFGLLAGSAWGCLYFDKNFDRSRFRETSREALLFRDQDAVNLILKTGFSGHLPADLAWVFPLPSKPISYREADPDVFTELRNHFLFMAETGGSKGGPRSAADMPRASIRVHETVTVGGYQIIPIEIVNPKGSGEELNSWLRKQNFNELPNHIQKPYLKKGAYFLAIRMKPQTEDMVVKPLWVRYKSSELSFPLRFTHDDRTFDLTLYFLGPKKQPRDLPAQSEWRSLDLPASTATGLNGLETLPKTRALVAKAVHVETLTRVLIQGVNTRFHTADLKADPGL